MSSFIVGLALTDGDRHLLQYAAMLHHLKIGGHFRFVHVVVPTASADAVDGGAVRDRMQTQVGEAFGADVAAGFEYDVQSGVRVDELLHYIEQNAADFVLLGHRRNRSGKRSLATRLAMISPRSIWMAPEGVPCTLDRVLAPIDYSQHSADSLRTAIVVAAQAKHSECLALHVYFDEATIRYDERDDQLRGDEQATFAEFVRPIATEGVRILPLFEEDSNVTRAILRVCAESRCDLIVMSTRGRSRAASILLGSETAQTLMSSSVPVLAVKHNGAIMNLFQALTNAKLWHRAGPKTN